MYKKNIICSFGSKIFTNFKMAACPSFIKMKRPSFVSQKMKLKKDMLPFWYLWIFLSQNFSLCSPCMYLLTLKRIKQFFNLFVSKKPLKNVSFVWKIGLGRFVFSTTVHTVAENECGTLRLRVSRFVHFKHLPIKKCNKWYIIWKP